MDTVAQAREIIHDASHVHFFTGAGMSADSGLDTFRDARTGLWEKVNPQDMASVEAWQRDPEPMWAWYLWRARLARRAVPHAGHEAIAKHSGKVTVTTQNIDDLHERAGSGEVAHLHGSLFAFRCSSCHTPYSREIELPESPTPRLAPPECEKCSGLIRPGVVWFGESLPQDQWEKAEEYMSAADAVVIVGTSGSVWPAAGLPTIAHRAKIPIIEVSPQRTDLSDLATVHITNKAVYSLPEILFP
ncbi:MAG: NAD-dependent deacylase [Corynebacterium casei]|uniref:NAD-dependent protein deacylase n=2 Tax=Corynebacterium casei TaxID=160386 RepID=G7I1T8_9CORY|nr:NAD-dependent deacylase [Corynebacterium casei]AHI18791.1 NAD-dependent deacetylase [Corynebacterium casei LMG S-19264]MDN5922113.1 NAD-dependent deacylase [Corynebacterium casei]MDN6272624.1 NAD-dependent deacylase [Corynebacterium casei]MDN6313173.1 NAD-dependent deacylase [Corynebacterium casei]MDN6464375.1 NAD-dependent deacylase [Corynebacterium casei]